MNIGTLTGGIVLEDRASPVMTLVGRNVATFAQKFESSLGVIAVGAATALVTSVLAISTAIIGLGNRGSDINDVAATFEHFAGSANNAAAAVEAMRKGTLGTVTDFDLMKSGTKLLAAGVQLTAQQFGTLSSAAFVLQNQGLGPTKDMLNLVSQALLTGQTRLLRQKIGVIDTTKAMHDYAASHHVLIGDLTRTQQLEATRTAILDAMARKVKEAGVQQRDFGELMEAGIVSIKNWGDSLARSVASSPHVMAAVNAIGASLVKSFGGDATAVLNTLVGWINKFADVVTNNAPSIIEAAARIKDRIVEAFVFIQGKVSDLWNWLVQFNERWQITTNLVAGAKYAWGLLQTAFDLVKRAVEEVTHAWSNMPDWLQRITRSALEGTAVLTIYAGALGLVLAPVHSLANVLHSALQMVYEFTSSIYYGQHVLATFSPGLERLREAYRILSVTIASNTAFIWLNTAATTAMEAGRAALITGLVRTINTIGAFNRAIGVTTIVEYACATATGVLSTAKLFLARAVLVATINYNALLLRIGVTPAVMGLASFATGALTAATTALGIALLGVKFILIPLIALYVAFKVALSALDFTGASEYIEYYSLKLQRLLGLLDKTITDQELWNSVQAGVKSRAAASGEAIDAEAMAFQALRDEITGKNLIDGVDRLDRILKSLGTNRSHEVLQRIADAGYELQKRGATLTPELAGIVSWLKDIEGEHPAFEIDKVTEALKRMQLTVVAMPLKDPFAPLLKSLPTLFPTFGPQVLQTVKPQEDLEGSTKAADEFAKAVRDLTKSLSGGDAIKAAQQYVAALKQLPSLALLTRDAQIKVSNTMEDAIAVYSSAGRRIPDDMQRIADEARVLTGVVREEMRKEVNAVEDQIDALDTLAEKWRLGPLIKGVRNLSGVVPQVGAIGAGNLAGINTGAADWAALDAASTKTLEGIAQRAKNTYEFAKKNSSLFSKAAIQHFKDLYIEADKTARGITDKWQKLGADLSNAIIGAIQGGGSIAGAVAGTIGQKIGTKLAGKLSESLSKVGTGALTKFLGGMLASALPVIGSLIGPLVSWLVTKFQNAGHLAATKFADSFKGGFKGIREQLLLLGDAGEAMWKRLTQDTNKKRVEQTIAEIQAALKALDDDIQHYNLTGTDLVSAQSGGTKAGADLVASYNRLVTAGYSVDAITKAMSADLSQYIIDSIRAGTKIPQALQPIIEKLIRTNQLTDAAKRAMLGLAEDTMPSLADIKDAADRDGLSLDALGPKVKQLSITEQANQIVKDFNLLTLAGADFNAIMNGGEDAAKRMGKQIQDLVTDSLKLGLELPESMRPIIEKMIEAGMLTDEFGKALTDTSRLKFAVDLNSMFEALIKKLDELIDKIGGVGGALNGLGGIVVEPKIKPIYDDSNIPDSIPMSGGGVVYAASGVVLPFKPRGTDTVPAMLTPGERVLTVSQNRAYEQQDQAAKQPQVTQVTITIHAIDGPSVMKVVASKDFKEELERQMVLNPRGLGTAVKKVANG